MDRRNFLFGVLAAPVVAVGGGVLVKAEPKAIELFNALPGTPVMVGAPMPVPNPSGLIGTMLFDYEGHPVAVVTRIDASREAIDVTERGDAYRRFRPGLMSVTLTATMHGAAVVKLASQKR